MSIKITIKFHDFKTICKPKTFIIIQTTPVTYNKMNDTTMVPDHEPSTQEQIEHVMAIQGITESKRKAWIDLIRQNENLRQETEFYKSIHLSLTEMNADLRLQKFDRYKNSGQSCASQDLCNRYMI
jgi:hypothetical protein